MQKLIKLKFWALLLVIITLCGCAPQQELSLTVPLVTATPTVSTNVGEIGTRGGVVLSMVLGEETETSPLLTRNRDLLSVYALCFEGLISLDDDMQPQPLLAESWDVSADGLTWTVTLRKDIVFHNGMPLVAEDVVENVNYIKGIGDNSPYYQSVSMIDTIISSGAHELIITSKKPTYGFLFSLDFPIIQYESLFDGFPAGTGPYKIQSFDRAKSLKLAINDAWWKRLPLLDTIVINIYQDIEVALGKLDLGEIDMLATKSLTASRYRGIPSFHIMDYSVRQYECLVPNIKGNFFGDVSVRQAIMHGIDINSIVANVYLNMGIPSDSPLPPGSWLYEPRAAQYAYNPEKAKQLLKENGWWDSNDNGTIDKNVNGTLTEFIITILTYEELDNPARKDAALLIGEQLAKIGITAEVVTKTQGNVVGDCQSGSFDLALVAYNFDKVPDLTFLYGTAGSNNLSGYTSTDMDVFLEQAMTTSNKTDFQLALSRIQMLASQDLPIMGMFLRSGMLISRKELMGAREIRDLDVYKGLKAWGYE